LDKKFGPDCGNPGHVTAADKTFSIAFVDMLCEMQHKTTKVSEYTDGGYKYNDICHKNVSKSIKEVTNDRDKREKLFSALKYSFCLDADEEDYDNGCVDMMDIIKNSTFTYCFRYKSDFKGRCEESYPSDTVYNNDCENLKDKNDNSVIVCIKLSNGDCKCD
jgi:hypothetical protein